MKKIALFVVLLLLVAIAVFNIKGSIATFGVTDIDTDETNKKQSTKIIVIDPGHGGVDPGKVGINGSLEKDINLSIALKMKALFEKEGFTVLMTRETDTGLYQESDSNKKRTDLRKRVEIINNSGAILAISIHQNSFQDESSRGAQVFYYSVSDKGRELAQIIQEQIKSTINDNNHRTAKSNNSYYMLKKTQCPLVIVECGFLSNNEESNLLIETSYQDKMALAIKDGIMDYLKQNT